MSVWAIGAASAVLAVRRCRRGGTRPWLQGRLALRFNAAMSSIAGQALADVTTVSRSPRVTGLIPGLARTARPRQWIKNLLVVAAPGAAGVLLQFDSLVSVAVAFGSFCAAASGTYFLNDARDWEQDRAHPVKRFRPVAAGVVPVGAARVAGVALLATAVLIAALLGSPVLAGVIGAYIALTQAYTHALKQVAVVELAAVAAGFVVRAIGGAVAVDVAVSNWFLIVTSFGSLLLVAGKRLAEVVELGDRRSEHRAVLGEYTESFLRLVSGMSCAVVVSAYCLWAFEKAALAAQPVWFQLSIVPFVVAVLTYSLKVDRGDGGAPEDLVLGNRTLHWVGLAWVTLFALGLYLGGAPS